MLKRGSSVFWKNVGKTWETVSVPQNTFNKTLHITINKTLHISINVRRDHGYCGYQGRNERGARREQFPGRRATMGAPNGCGGRRKVPTMSQVLPSTPYICLQRPQARTWGRQTCFLPRAPSNLVMPLVVAENLLKLGISLEIQRNAVLIRT